MSATTPVADWQFEQYVGAEAEGYASDDELAVLEADRHQWRSTLLRMLQETEEHLASARALRGDEREIVVADFESELRNLADAWTRLTSEPNPWLDRLRSGTRRDAGGGSGATRETSAPAAPREPEAEPANAGVVALQVSWEPGRVVAWAGGPRAALAGADEVTAMLAVPVVWLASVMVIVPTLCNCCGAE